MKHFDICGEAQCFSVCQIKDKCFIWTLFNILCVPLSCWTASWHSHSMLQFFLSCVGSPFQIVLSSMVKHFCICKYYSALFLSESRKKKKWGKIVSCGKCYFYRTAFSTEMPQLQKTSSQLYLKHIPGVLFTTYECQLLTFIPNDLDYKKKLFRISVQIKLIEIPCTRYVDQNVAIVTEIHQHY